VKPAARLESFGPRLYSVEGAPVSFLGVPYPTRMAVAQLPSGAVWVWSPIQLTDQLVAEVELLGPVQQIVTPNKLHHLFLQQWKDRWPHAHIHAPPGLARKRSDLRFSSELGDDPSPAWEQDIEQVVFRGSFAMEEVAFYHRPSRTAIFGDLIQRFPESSVSGLHGMFMRLDGLVGDEGSTPRDWRLSFLRRGPARQARAKVAGWRAERLLIAHGRCVSERAEGVIAAALAWI